MFTYNMFFFLLLLLLLLFLFFFFFFQTAFLNIHFVHVKGLLDIPAYLPPELWTKVLGAVGYDEATLAARYDMVRRGGGCDLRR